MAAYLDVWKKFGWRMFGSFVVGSLAALIPMIFLGVILVVTLIAIGITSVDIAGADPFYDIDIFLESLFTPVTIAVMIIFFILFFIGSILTSAFTSAGSIGIASAAMQERRVTVGTFFRYGFRRLFPMLGLSLMQMVMAIIPGIPLIIAIFLFAHAKAWSVILGIIFVLLTVLAYLLYALIVLHAPTILITERAGVFASIAGSYLAFRNRFPEVMLSALILLGIVIAGGIITFIIQLTIVGLSFFDLQAEPDPFRNLLGNVITFPIQVGIQLVAVVTLVFRYLHIIKVPPTGVAATPTASGTVDTYQQPPHSESDGNGGQSGKDSPPPQEP